MGHSVILLLGDVKRLRRRASFLGRCGEGSTMTSLGPVTYGGRSSPPSPAGLYARGTLGRHHDHRDSRCAVAARGAVGPRSGPETAMPEQPQATRAGAPELSHGLRDVSNRCQHSAHRAAGDRVRLGANWVIAILPYIENQRSTTRSTSISRSSIRRIASRAAASCPSCSAPPTSAATCCITGHSITRATTGHEAITGPTSPSSSSGMTSRRSRARPAARWTTGGDAPGCAASWGPTPRPRSATLPTACRTPSSWANSASA